MLIAGKIPAWVTRAGLDKEGRFGVIGGGHWDIKWGWPYGSGFIKGGGDNGWGDNDGRTTIQDPLELTLLLVETISCHESRS